MRIKYWILKHNTVEYTWNAICTGDSKVTIYRSTHFFRLNKKIKAYGTFREDGWITMGEVRHCCSDNIKHRATSNRSFQV
jgi:hypothetical protein